MKYVIDIDIVPYLCMTEGNNMSPPLYKAKGFNSLVFDQNGLDKLEKYEDADALQIEMDAKFKGYDSGFKKGYDNGAGDAWAFARAMFYPKAIGGTNAENFNECYHGKSAEEVLKDMSYEEAKIRYDAWKQEKESQIKVGDEVEHESLHNIGFVTRVEESGINVVWNCGRTGFCGTDEVKKTGKYFGAIVDILKNMCDE